MENDTYRNWARLYDILLEPGESRVRRLGLQIFPPRENLSILDVGCGTGTQLGLYRRDGCKLHGVDLSPGMVAVARRKLGDTAELSVQDATRLDYPSQTFDFVSVVLVIHEMPASLRPAVLSECKRVAKADGRIMVIEWHLGPYEFPMGYIYRLVRRSVEFVAGRQHYANYCDFKRRGGMEPLIDGARLSVDKRIAHGIAVAYLLKP
jgi:ubiquinone/menaquinone biosynthesis C-methylase UbiE